MDAWLFINQFRYIAFIRLQAKVEVRWPEPQRPLVKEPVQLITFSSPIDGVPHLELVGMLALVSVQLVSQQDVLFRLVREDQPQLRGVGWVTADVADQLEHWSYAGTTWNHE